MTKKLMSERIDCLIATEQLTWYHANELGIATNPAALETPIAAISVFFAISRYTKNIADPQAFMKDMNA